MLAFEGQSPAADYTGAISQIPTWKKKVIVFLSFLPELPFVLSFCCRVMPFDVEGGEGKKGGRDY